jgi:hypothetical protein
MPSSPCDGMTTQTLWQRTSLSWSGTTPSRGGGLGVVQSPLGVPSPGACLATLAGSRGHLGGHGISGCSLVSPTPGP